MKQKKRTGRRLLSFVLTLVMVVGLMPGMGLTAYAATWSGEGTESSPYLISSLDDLKSLRDSVNGGTDYSGKYFKLTADIDCGTDNWVPIGKSEMGMEGYTYYDFKGTFDGNGKTVTYHVADSSDDYIGLFAFFMNGATVKNLSVAGSISGSGEYYGGIAGDNYSGTIQNCSSSVSITGSADEYGGIAGNNNGTIDHCVASGALIWNFIGRTGAYAAGITAINAGTVNNCVSLCDISAENVSNSGYAGRVIAWQQSGTVADCYYLSTANITGNNVNASNATAKTADELKAIGETAYNDGYTVYALACGYGSHTHSFTYSFNNAGDTITATCSADGCTLPPRSEGGTDHVATLTIAPSSSGGYGASLSGDAAEFGVTDANIEYSSDNGSTWSTTVPSTAGSYQARIKVTDATDNAKTCTATVSYGVNTITTDKTYTPDNDHGTVTVPEAAAANTTVTINTTPAAAFQLESLTVTKAGGGTVSVTKDGNNGTFTMPAENVTVSATFVGKDITVNLNDPIGGGSVCTASLLDSDYNEVKSLTAKAGGKFILSINKDEDYFYKVSLGSDIAVSMEEFSVDDYKAYIQNAESKNVSVSLDTYLFWVTMPGVNADSVNMTVTFAEAKTFTILYQPTTSADEVWVKFGYTGSGQDKLVTAKMSKDAAMGNAAVWSLKMSAAFNPEKIAFATSESGLDSATMITNVTVSQNDEWKTITNTNDKYLIIGNNAKTVIAAFTDDSDSSDVDREATVIRIGDDAEYQIAICGTDGNGTVTTPDAPTKAGYEFVAWRGYEGITAKDYAANTQISVKENMVFSAVWKPVYPKVKLNLDGGMGIDDTAFTVSYEDNTTLASLTPVKSGFSFVGWSVAKDVTEDGKVYTKGAPFDTGTKITADLELTAQWKHVHAYRCIQIGAVSSLATKYEKYAPYLHIRICGCGDVDLEAHSLDSSGRCVCGYSKPAAPSTAELNVSYGQWQDGNYTEKMAEVPEKFAVNSEVSVSAPGKWGSLKFSKWQYSTDNGTSWDDLAACTMLSFIIPGNMKMRALYVNDTQKPEVSMSATTYATKPANMDQEYNSILFRMNYKLPDGYTYVDAGVRSGDNAGISYYELKERTATMDGEMKAIAYSAAAAMTVLRGGYLTTFDTSVTEQYYAKREDSVLGEAGMNATTLGEYMYRSKPINIQDPPLYWNYKPNTKGQSGSINALTPVGFAQRNNGDHYIYAIAWLQYKKPDGKVETIWTDAMDTTLNGVLQSVPTPVSKTGN